MKVLICGSRDWDDPSIIWLVLDGCLADLHEEATVVHGGARGADRVAGEWAEERSVPYIVFPADWDTHGKGAGYVRNRQMASYLTQDEESAMCFAFKNNFNWDLNKGGTENMVKLCREAGVPTYVVSRAA